MSQPRVIDPYRVPIGAQVDGWRVIQRVNSGGFGTVYVVEQEGQRCALKLAQWKSAPDDASRANRRLLQRELVILARLMDVPNIARLEGCGFWRAPGQGQPYLLMEYVEGDHVDAWAERYNPTFRELARVFAKVADALGKAHELGILHRDLKPENILVRGKDSEPVIVDFGSGDFEQANTLTAGGTQPPVTARYRSPEMAAFYTGAKGGAGGHYDFKPTDDLYSLALCLYETVTETSAYLSRSNGGEASRLAAEVVARHYSRPKALTRNPRVPASLSHYLERLLARDPAFRPPTGAAISRALLELADEADKAWDRCTFAHAPPPRAPDVQRAEPVSAPPEAAPPPPPPARPPQLAEALVEPAARRTRAPLAWVLMSVLGLGLLLVLAAFLHARKPAAREEPAPPLETADLSKLLPKPATGQAPLPPALSKEPEPMTTANAAPPSAAAAPEQSPQPQARTSSLAARCSRLTAGTAIFVQLGCAGAQLRPPAARDCPPGSAEAMASLGLKRGDIYRVWLDENQSQLGGGDRGVYRAGEIVGLTVDKLDDGNPLPKDTRLFGRLYVDPSAERMWVRYTEAQLPGAIGRVPVCLTIERTAGAHGEYAYPIDPGSRVDAAIGEQVVVVAPHFGRWPRFVEPGEQE